MHEAVREELNSIRQMVLTWKDSYSRMAAHDGEDVYLVEEFVEEIEMHVYPYIRRMFQCSHIDAGEAGEFMNFCAAQVKELREELVAVEPA